MGFIKWLYMKYKEYKLETRFSKNKPRGTRKNMEIYEDGENWCHREIFNEDGTLIEDNFECPDECCKCGYWNHLVD